MADIQSAILIETPFAQKWEGTPPKDSNGNYIAFNDHGTITIGWGSTFHQDGSLISEGETMTPAEGDALFQWELNQKANLILPALNLDKITNNQFAALIDLAYEAGQGAVLNNQLLLDATNSGDIATGKSILASAPPLTENGVFVQGIQNRRTDESMLYSGNYSPVYSYYLRNQSTIDSAAIIAGSVIAIGLLFWGVAVYRIRNKK